MAASMVDKFLGRTRGKSEEELHGFYSSLFKVLTGSPQTNDRERGDAQAELRKLFVYIACTKHRRRLPQQLVDKLKSLLIVEERGAGSSGVRGRLLASAVLQEYAPSEQLDVDGLNPPTDLRHVPYVLPVLMNQGLVLGQTERLVPLMVRWVSTVGFDTEIQARALGCLVTVATLHRSLLSGEQIYVVSSQISDWLAQASTNQASLPGARQKSKRTEQVTEIDGSPCPDFFTLLHLGQLYSPDQLLNLHSFAGLRQWLLATHFGPPASSSSSPLPSPSSPGGLGSAEPHGRRSSALVTSGSFAAKARRVLVERACEYCLRVLDQCERKPTKFQDQEVMQACQSEVISLLDVLCRLDSSLVVKIFPAVKGLYNRLSSEAAQPRVLLTLLQFFIDHNEMLVYDPQPAMEHFFGEVLAGCYDDPSVAFDTVLFCRDNLHKLCLESDVLEKFFPNLLKILAWNPQTFLMDFLDILPAMISPTTAVEILHTLLDLPCLVMALEVSRQASRPSNQAPDSYHLPELPAARPSPALEAFRNPEHRPWFSYILRSRSGQGDTISKLSFLHNLLSDTSAYPRVIPVSQTVPILMKLFFQTVFAGAENGLLCQLVPVILERAGLLFSIPSFVQEVRKVLADELLALFKQCPSLVMDLKAELLDYVSSLRSITGKEDFFSHVVWIIGDYTSTAFDSRCNTEVIIKFYETLETLLYEVSVLVQSSSSGQVSFSARLMTVCMAALAKLASRCQDLIPRVLLCLTKVSQQQMRGCMADEQKRALLQRANELINVLKLPDVAAAVLSPTSEMEDGHWHQDPNTSVPMLMQAAHQLVQQGT